MNFLRSFTEVTFDEDIISSIRARHLVYLYSITLDPFSIFCINQAFSLSTSSNRGDLNNEWMAYIILWNLDGCKNCNATVHTLKKDNQYFTGPKFNRCNILFIGSQYHTKQIMLRIVFYDKFHVIINKRKYWF